MSFQKDGGDLSHVLPSKANVSALRTRLMKGSYQKHLQDAIAKGDNEELKKFLLIENNWNGVQQYIVNDARMHYLFEFSPKDKVANLIRNNPNVYKHVVEKYNQVTAFKEIVDSCLTMNGTDKFSKKLEKDILAKYPNHPILVNVTRDIVKKLKRHNLSHTQGRRSFVADLAWELKSTANGKNFGVASFDDIDIQWFIDTMGKIGRSTHKGSLSNNTTYWEVMDKLLMHENKKNNVTGKKLDVTFKTRPGFDTIYDWKSLERLGWKI
jgi:hypothetical protein